jgi:hypothetical protein
MILQTSNADLEAQNLAFLFLFYRCTYLLTAILHLSAVHLPLICRLSAAYLPLTCQLSVVYPSLISHLARMR